MNLTRVRRAIRISSPALVSRKTMATASIIKLQATQRPEYYWDGISEGAMDKASELLQKNHDTHHIFFNHDGDYRLSYTAKMGHIADCPQASTTT